MSVALHRVNSASPVESDAFRVFNAALQRRLAAINAATRSLREMGYRVVGEELLPPRGGRPVVRIDRGIQQSLGPLLDRATDRRWRDEGARRRGFVAFMNVTVTWEPT